MQRALDVLRLAKQHVEVERDLGDLRLPRLHRLADHVARVALQRLDPHVVVHLLLHVRCLGKLPQLVGDDDAVEHAQVDHVEEQVGLVVAERAQRVVAKVWLRKGQRGQPAHARQIRDVFKVGDEVAGQVELLELRVALQRVADGGDAIGSEPQAGQVRQVLQSLHPLDRVVVHPQRLQLAEARQHRPLHLSELVVAQVEVCERGALLDAAR